MIRDKLRVFLRMADLSQEDAARRLDEKYNTFRGWVRTDQEKPNRPDFDTALPKIAARFYLNLNWLADVPGAEMWSREFLRPLRKAIREYVRTMTHNQKHADRIGELLRFTNQFTPVEFDAPILRAASANTRQYIESVLAGENPGPGTDTPQHLARFWDLNPAWLLGEEVPPFKDDLQHRVQIIYLLDEYGISNDTIIENMEVLRDLEKASKSTNE